MSSLDVDPERIFIDREARQRKVIKIDDILPSIQVRGVLQPIIIEPYSAPGFDYKLIAGERRLTTVKFLKHSTIPARLFSGLSLLDRELIEFEENAKRSDLTWQEKAAFALRIHRIYLQLNPGQWSETDSAKSAGLDPSWFNRSINAGEALEAGDETIAGCDTLSAAINILSRRAERATAALTAQILETENEIAPDVDIEITGTSSLPSATPPLLVAGVESNTLRPVPAPTPVSFDILEADMEEYLSTYEGRRFNLLHCDLPYGVPLNGMANQDAFEGGGYESNPDIYFHLMRMLAKHWDRFMLPQSHIMFWISMEFYTPTMQFFEENFPWLVMQKTPLVWHKTDNKGIIPDPMRQGRRIYEACLYGSSDDRKIVKPIGNAYGCPSSKEIHTNEKSQPMLNHFLSMFVDETTRILDPTCGSGSAIRAAQTLGASYGLGLERNPEFADRARTALTNQIKLADLAKKV